MWRFLSMTVLATGTLSGAALAQTYNTTLGDPEPAPRTSRPPADRPSGVGRRDPSPSSPAVSTSRSTKSTITGREFGDVAPRGGPSTTVPAR